MNSTPTTFIEIFNKELTDGKTINNIEIPIIQRDYAQGRETKAVTRIREQFVNALFKALTGDSKEAIKLDFVYGNIEKGKLIPLDGQQRLTTLFLLHWYIAKQENIDEEKQQFLNNFKYKTRFSSQHFCESLVKSKPNFNGKNLSGWIMDQNWFMYSWEQDPTIHSMLVMIDKIHEVFQKEFKEEVSLWDKLTNSENQPISFYFLALEDMGLTDNLYIKMNSRGKPLTEFEHFKAEFEKMIKAVSMDLYNEFVKKVDVDWVDMLWKYRGDDNLIDDEFMRYYRFVTEMICFEQEIEILENDFDLANQVYGIKNINAKENLRFLFKSFDCWNEIENIATYFDSIFSNTIYEKDKVAIYADTKDLFLLCCVNYGIVAGNRRNFSLINTLLLYSVLQYLLNKETVSEQEFTERIRIIRNLTLNSSDEIREKRMQALLKDTKSIVVDGDISNKTLGYNEAQKNEEINKISWRSENPSLIEDINRLEDHFLLQGSIAIIGLTEPEKFKLRAVNFKNLFNNAISYKAISNALLTIDDYSQLASFRFLFGNNNFSTWRELFTPSNQRKRFENTRATLLKLLDEIKIDFEDYLNNLVIEYLNNKNQIKDWRYYFIKYPEMRKGDSGVYYWKNDPTRTKNNQYELVMMNTSKALNGKHWDPFLYVLFNDNELKEFLSLEDYGAPLIINHTGKKVKCMNSCWEIYDCNDVLIEAITITQENGIDEVDRIELIKTHLNSLVK